MTKDQLLDAMASKSGLSKRDAASALDAFIDAVTSALSSGDNVALTGFGAFQVSHRKARAGVNPKTGAKLQIPAMKVPKFKAGKALKEATR
ncbi:MAG: DNA-binding protein HU [Candidatus Spechtbacteria bacterium RIFCSPLOWO2_01_FULL_46_10]|uniref:DNA-binding protein HU n=1 Tax=Candidatus Spechtbacteria bacterium RIFCSPLOWO2_01_FULL_46_10 TaxID=1802163 RepID=A0A1G2HG51_9BACT|nr:MAG: DNA-binding protein HU [Candidatus Spechtbacteria bacterium RIFCSPLOWO2_01_FULL_46_10]